MFSGVLDALVGESDPVLDDRLRELELARRERDAELAAAILVAEQRGIYGRDGHRTMNAYLRATFNWSNAEAGRWRAQARAIGAIDGVGAALAAGRIGAPQVGEFAKAHSNPRVRDALEALAPTLLRHAEELSFADFQIVLQHAMKLADEDGAAQDEHDAIESRSATVADVDGALYLHATGGDAMSTAELVAILERFVQLEFAKDAEARRAEHGDDISGIPLARSASNRRFDAIHAIFNKANGALDAELPEGVKPEPLVNVVIDDATLGRILESAGLAPASSLDGHPVDPFTGLLDPSALLAELVEHPDELLNRRCETTNGVQLSSKHVLQAVLAGHVRRAVVNAQSVTIDYGHKKRLFVGPARDAALLLL